MNTKIISSIVILLLSFFNYSTLPSPCAINQEPLKIAFILDGRANDLGWNYAQNEGRLFLEKEMLGKVKTTVVENIPESAEVERVMEKLISQGNKLIFTTSYGYLEPALRVAARHPEIIVMQCQRSVPSSVKNMGTYYVRQHDPSYPAGIVAGRMTKTNKLGYIGGHAVPILVASLNAYALGAKSVNPKITVHAVWLNTWADAALEVEAAKGLIDSGVDVILSELDSSLTTVKTCEANHAFSVSANVNLQKFGPTSWLTGQYFNWGPLYVKITQSVLNHTWKPSNKIYDTKDGYSALSPCSNIVPLAVRKEANLAMKQIADGTLSIFKGPLKDRDGNVRANKGQVLNDKDLAGINWVVPGIEGPMPKNK